MAKRERNKRSARKARQQERERVAAARAASGVDEQSSKKSFFKGSGDSGRKATKNVAVTKADRKGFGIVTGYFSDVRSEMRQVTWPPREELRNYSVAVIATLIVFGVAIWAVDTGFVAMLAKYIGLRG